MKLSGTCVAVLVVAACRTTALAADTQSLKGISGLWILVENLDADLQQFGLTKEELHAEIEDRLGLGGIAVEPPSASGAGPFLYLAVANIAVPPPGKRKLKAKARPAGITLYVRLELQQAVVLKRNPSASLLSDTWHQSLMGYTEPARAGETARKWVQELTERFVRAYRAANP